MEPNLVIKTFQILQGQVTGFHFLISFLKSSRVLLFLISEGICSRILGPRYEPDSLPLKDTVNWICGEIEIVVYASDDNLCCLLI